MNIDKTNGFVKCDICGETPGTILKPDYRKNLKIWRCCNGICSVAEYKPKNLHEKFLNWLDHHCFYDFIYHIFKFLFL